MKPISGSFIPSFKVIEERANVVLGKGVIFPEMTLVVYPEWIL